MAQVLTEAVEETGGATRRGPSRAALLTALLAEKETARRALEAHRRTHGV